MAGTGCPSMSRDAAYKFPKIGPGGQYRRPIDFRNIDIADWRQIPDIPFCGHTLRYEAVISHTKNLGNHHDYDYEQTTYLTFGQ